MYIFNMLLQKEFYRNEDCIKILFFNKQVWKSLKKWPEEFYLIYETNNE